MKRKIIGLMIIVAFLVLAVESVAAAPADKVEGFVCPILGGKAGQNGNHKGLTNLYDDVYTVLGPNVIVPGHATNRNGDGRPAPGQHDSPGDDAYTAIWGFRPPA